jgi:phosphatidylserine decarboxylase
MPTGISSLSDKLKSWPLVVLPHQLLSRLIRSATRWRVRWWKDLLIQLFVHHFRVDMSSAQYPAASDYPDFNSFFTRALQPGVRPLPDAPQGIASPVDGCVSELGDISTDRLLQAKGRDYSLTTLLGGDAPRAAPFQGGKFVTLYLSPRDYHRIHMPVDGRLLETTYVPGRLFSVAPHTTRAIPGLFTRNERLVAVFETPCGPMAMVMVGAIFVSCMETVWDGVVNPSLGMAPETRRFGAPEYPDVELQRGAEAGRFNMGSTVILVYGPGQVDWSAEIRPGSAIRMGQRLGDMRSG